MNKYIVLTVALFAFVACKSHKQMTRDQIKMKLDSVEMSFKKNKLDYNLLQRAAMLMDKYSRDYSDDTLAAYFLFRSGEMYSDQQNYDEALKKYNDVRVRFPNSQYSAKSLFTMAYLYDDKLNKKDKAKEFYQMFIDKYPTDPLSASAKASIETMNVPIDSLVKRFERKQDSMRKAKRS